MKSVLVPAHICLAVLFLVLAFITVILPVSVVSVLVRIVFFRPVLFVIAQIITTGGQPVAVADIHSYVRVRPLRVRICIFISSGNTIRVVILGPHVDVSAHRLVVITVVIPDFVTLAITLLEIVALPHIFFITKVRVPVILAVITIFDVSLQVRSSLAQSVPISMLVSMIASFPGPSVIVLSPGNAC